MKTKYLGNGLYLITYKNFMAVGKGQRDTRRELFNQVGFSVKKWATSTEVAA